MPREGEGEGPVRENGVKKPDQILDLENRPCFCCTLRTLYQHVREVTTHLVREGGDYDHLRGKSVCKAKQCGKVWKIIRESEIVYINREARTRAPRGQNAWLAMMLYSTEKANNFEVIGD